MTKARWAALILTALTVLAGWALWPSREPPSIPSRGDPRVVEIVIPRGTARKIAAGGKVPTFPSEITLTAGVRDRLVIRNEDEAGHGVGPLWVKAGEALTLRFGKPGTYSMGCSLDPEHVFRIVVLEPPSP